LWILGLEPLLEKGLGFKREKILFMAKKRRKETEIEFF
jgi:hypothetical protein